MKKLITLAIFAVLLSMAGSAYATIGWAGNIWPNGGSAITPTGAVDVYIQVWKDGVTSGPGQGADITVEMSVTNDIGGTDTVVFAYLGDQGDNDEYSGQISQAMILGAGTVTVDFTVTDVSDGTTFYPVQDQAGNYAPLTYNVTDVLPNDVDVTFSICLSGAETIGDVCVVGSAPELTVWGAGVPLTLVSGELYEGTITFAAGSNPAFEYKFKKDDCNTWEGAPNRLVTLPTDGTTAVVLDTQSWDNLPIACGLGNTLEEDKEVCFQVCMDGVENSGGVCLMGVDGNWDPGYPMTNLGGGLFQFCKVYPAGMPIPLSVEFKFKKDDCATWESVGNRVVVIENAMDPSVTLTNSWDDLGGVCEPVATEGQSWDALKSMYR